VKQSATHHSPSLPGRSSRGWRILQAAATAGFILAVAALGSVATAEPHLRAPAALLLGGLTAIRGLVAYGARRQARWAAWAGGVLAGVLVLWLGFMLPVAGLLAAAGGSIEVSLPPLFLALAVGQAAANVAFLYGLLVLRRERS